MLHLTLKSFMLWSSAATLLLAAAACTEETPVEVRQGTEFLNASNAVYDGKAGTYSVELTNDSCSLNFVLSTQYEGLAADSPVPSEGAYMIASSDTEHSVESGAAWTDADGVQHQASQANIFVSPADGACGISGTMTDAGGELIKFSCSNVTFSHTISACTDYDSAYEEVSEDSHSLLLATEGQTLIISMEESPADGANEIAEAYVLSEGDTAAVTGLMYISRQNGGYSISGYAVPGSSEEFRFRYEGAVLPAELMRPDLYSLLGGDWYASSSEIVTYDADKEEWISVAQDYSDDFSAIGLPDLGYFYMTGLFDPSFSFLAEVHAGEDNMLRIPCNPQTNPAAMVTAGLGTQYLLFVTLYNPDSGNFLIGSSYVPVLISEDFQSMTVQSYTTDNGEYTHLGLIGMTASGSYSMFSNWPFVELPSISRTDGSAPASSPATVRISGEAETGVIDSVIPADSITEIIPIKRF